MSERHFIEADARSVVGKKVKRLRKENLVPGIIYGQGSLVNIQLDRKPLRRVLRAAGSSDLIDVEVNGRKHTVLVRDIQKHVTRDDVMHVDFMEVDMASTVTTSAELVGVGWIAEGLEAEGSLQMELHAVDIECLPGDLVSQIEVDLTKIQTTQDQILVSDLPVPPGVTILNEQDTLVARFALLRTIEELEEEEEEEEDILAPDSVEVIEKGKQEEEEF